MSKKKQEASQAQAYTGKVYDFCSKKKMILIIAICVVVALIAGALIRGVKFAIEFKGGTLLTYSYTGDLDTDAVDAEVEKLVDSNVNVRRGESLDSDGYQITISFTSKEGLNADGQHELTENLRAAFPDNELELFDSNDVSPSSGREFLLKCLLAMVFAAILIIIYIAIRFSRIGGWSAGICSIFALCHDILAALAVSIICGFEFNSNIVAVILTILGYSINNTIVIYDRIRENRTLMPKASLNELINTGCSQSLTRSIRTSVTTIGTMLVVTIVVLISGYNSLLSFSVPLMAGLISGTYSSLFVAPVTWSWWKGSKKAPKKDKKNDK
jgi:preprotein translocase subunit SecF